MHNLYRFNRQTGNRRKDKLHEFKPPHIVKGVIANDQRPGGIGVGSAVIEGIQAALRAVRLVDKRGLPFRDGGAAFHRESNVTATVQPIGVSVVVVLISIIQGKGDHNASRRAQIDVQVIVPGMANDQTNLPEINVDAQSRARSIIDIDDNLVRVRDYSGRVASAVLQV